jgi:hypothetical protein
MKYCGKCGEPISNLGQLVCNNCSSPIQPTKDQQAQATDPPPGYQQPPPPSQAPGYQQPPLTGQAPGYQQPPLPGQAPGYQQPPPPGQGPGYQQAPYPNQFYNQPNNTGVRPTETEDISRAFYTTETGEVLPLYQQGHQEDGKPKKKFLLPLLIGIGVIAAIAITIGLVASGIFASPVDRFIAIQRTHVIDPLLAAYEDFEETEYSFDLFVTAGGEVSGINPGIMMALTFIEEIALEINYNSSVDPVESILGFTLNVAGADFLSAIITADEEYMGFSIPTIDDTHYVISFEAFSEMLGTGVFMPQLTPEEAASVIERYSDIFLSIVNEDNLEVNREPVSLFGGREEPNAQVYTVTPTENDFYDYFLALIEEFRDDEFMYQAFAASVSPWTLDFLGYQNTRQYWNSVLNDFEDDLDEIVETLADSGFQWRVATYRRQLILQEVTLTIEDVNLHLRYEGLLSGNQRTDWFSFGGGGDNNDEVLITLRNSMTVSTTEANGNAEFGVIARTDFDDLDLSVDVSYDVDITTFSILEIPYGMYELDFRLTERLMDISFEASLLVEAGLDGGSDHIITIYNLDDIGLSHFTINIHSTDEPSDIQAPTGRTVDLSEMSETDMFFTLMEIMNELESLLDFFNQF